MSRRYFFPPTFFPRPLSPLLLLALLALLTLGSRTAAAPTRPHAPADPGPAVTAVAPAALVAAAWMKKAYTSLEWALSTQGGLIRCAFLGMFLGLLIIWWRR